MYRTGVSNMSSLVNLKLNTKPSSGLSSVELSSIL
jgi:hypothetical protein